MAGRQGFNLKGRPKGVTNIKRRQFLEILEHHNFHPAEAMMHIYATAMKEYEMGDDNRLKALSIAADMVKDIAGFVMPKLKSIEHIEKNPLDDMTAKEKLEAMRQGVRVLEVEVAKSEAMTIEKHK